jgi:hypothetical protein
LVLVTSRFVVINLPKTGSSFVRQVIKRIYARRRWRWRADRFLKELMLPRTRYAGVDQHGWVSQIPNAYRHLPIVSVVRNPYERMVSDYDFRWWADHPNLPAEELQRRFPHFPDLSFDEFAEFWDVKATQRLNGENPLGLGFQTVQFVNFFFLNYGRALSSLGDDYVESGAFREDMADVTFLRQERLRDELAAWLQRFDFSEAEVELCRTYPLVNPTIGGMADRRSLWTEKAIATARTRERFLFQMLAQLGVDYQAPSLPNPARTESETVS